MPQTRPVNMDEIVEETLLIPIRERTRAGRWQTRIAAIRDYVPMRLLNRYYLNRQHLAGLPPALHIRWMVQQVAMVWRQTEPTMTVQRLAEGLSLDQVQRLIIRFFTRPAPRPDAQSFERLNFASGPPLAGSVVPAAALQDMPLVSEDWDAEAREQLLAQAAAVEESDPMTAQYLRAQAVKSWEAAQTSAAPTATPLPTTYHVYDGMRLYAQMGSTYPWMSQEVIDQMHFPTFFGYVREAILQQRRIDAQTRPKSVWPTAEDELRQLLQMQTRSLN